MHRLFIFIAAWIILCSFPLTLLAEHQSNARIFQMLMQKSATEIESSLLVKNISLQVLGGSEIRDFARMEFIASLSSHVTVNEQVLDTSLTIRIDDIAVSYIESSTSDSLIRECTVQLTGIIKHGNISKNIPLKKQEYRDIISIDDIPLLEQPDYAFCKGKKPDETSSFFKEIIQPIVFIGTAAFSVFLLYSVRSQ